MKKYFLVMVFLFSALSFSQAQMRKEYKWGCTFAINNIYTPMGLIGDATIGLSTDGFWNGGGIKKDNSYSFSIIPKYLISKDLNLRFEFGVTRINQSRVSSVSNSTGILLSTTYPQTSDKIEQKTYKYVPGIQWSPFSDRKIEMHIGISVPYMHYSNLIYSSQYEIRNRDTDSLTFKNETYRNVPGGYGLGIGALAGFDFYLLKKLSIGAEFSNAFIYYNIGGDATANQTIIYPTNISGTGTSIIPESYKGMRLEKIFSSFNISIYL